MPKRGEPNGGKRKGGGHQPPEPTVAFDRVKEILEKTPPLPSGEPSSIPDPSAPPTLEEQAQDPLIYQISRTKRYREKYVRGKKVEKTRTLGEIKVNQHEPIVVLSADVPSEIPPEKRDDWRYQQYVFRAQTGRPQWKPGQEVDAKEFQSHRRIGEEFDPLFMLGTIYEGEVEAAGTDQQLYHVPVIVQYVGTPRRENGELAPFSGKFLIVGHLRSISYPENASPTERYALYAVNADWKTALQSGIKDFTSRQITLKSWETYFRKTLAPLKGALEGLLQRAIKDPTDAKEEYELLTSEINEFLDTVNAIDHQLAESEQKMEQFTALPDPRFLIEEYGEIRKNVRHGFTLIEKLRNILSFLPPGSIPPPPAPPQERVSVATEPAPETQAQPTETVDEAIDFDDLMQDVADAQSLENVLEELVAQAQHLLIQVTQPHEKKSAESKLRIITTQAEESLTFLQQFLNERSPFAQQIARFSEEPDGDMEFDFPQWFQWEHRQLREDLPRIEKIVPTLRTALSKFIPVEVATTSQAETIHLYLKAQQDALIEMFEFLRRVPDVRVIESTDPALVAQLANVADTLDEMAKDEECMAQLDLYLEDQYAPEPNSAFLEKFEKLKRLMPEIQSVVKRLNELHIHGDLAVSGPPPLPRRPAAAQEPGATPERPAAPTFQPPKEKEPIVAPFTDAWVAQMSKVNKKLWEQAKKENKDLTPADIPNNLAVFEGEGKETEMVVEPHPTKQDAFFVTIAGQKTTVSLSEFLKRMATGIYFKRIPVAEAPSTPPEPFTDAWLQTLPTLDQSSWVAAKSNDPSLQLTDIPNNLQTSNGEQMTVELTSPDTFSFSTPSVRGTEAVGDFLFHMRSGRYVRCTPATLVPEIVRPEAPPVSPERVTPEAPPPAPEKIVIPPAPEPPPPLEPFTEAWLVTLDPHNRDSWQRASAAHPEISLSDIPNNLQMESTGVHLTIQVDPTDANLHIVHFGDNPSGLSNSFSELFRAIESGAVVKRGFAPRREAAQPGPPRPPEPLPPIEPPRRPQPRAFTQEWLGEQNTDVRQLWHDVQQLYPTFGLGDLQNGLRFKETGEPISMTPHPIDLDRIRAQYEKSGAKKTHTVQDTFMSILRGDLEPRRVREVFTPHLNLLPEKLRKRKRRSEVRRPPEPTPRGAGEATAVTGFRVPGVEPIVHRPLTGWRRYLPSLHELTTGWSQSGHRERERSDWGASLQHPLLHPFDLFAFSAMGRKKNRETRLQREIDRREAILKAPLDALKEAWQGFTERYNEGELQWILYVLQDPAVRQVLYHIDTLDRSEKTAYEKISDTEKKKQMKTGPDQYVNQVLGEIHLLPDQRAQIVQLIELEAELQRLDAILTETMALEQRGGLHALIDVHLIDAARVAEFPDVKEIAESAEQHAKNALRDVEQEWSELPDDDARRTQALASIKDPFLHRIILGDQTTYTRGDRIYKKTEKEPERFVAAHERQGAAMLPQNRKYVRGPLKNATPFANYLEGVRRGIALQPLEKRTKLWDETTKYLQTLAHEMNTARFENRAPDKIQERITQLERLADKRIESVKALWEAVSSDPASRLAIVQTYVDWPGVQEIVRGIMNHITTHSGDYDWNLYLPAIYDSFDRSNFRVELREVWMQKLNEHIAVLERKLTTALQKRTDALIGRGAETGADEGEEGTKKRKRKRR